MERLGTITGMLWRTGEATADGREAAIDRTRVFETLVAEHAAMVFRVAYSVLRNSHDAEDVVQETFLNAWQARTEQVDEPRAWLAKIAWRAAVRRARRRPEQTSDEKPEAISPELDPEEQAVAAQQRRLLDQMIATLPEELRHPLMLSTMGEMNSREIGQVLGIPEASVRTRLFRARQMLKEKLAAQRRDGAKPNRDSALQPSLRDCK